jgi:hypothetical protein
MIMADKKSEGNIVHKRGNYMEIDGILYKLKMEPQSDGKMGEIMEFIPVESDIDVLIDEIAGILKNNLDPAEVLRNAMYDMDESEIIRLHDKLTKQKTKPRIEKEWGCMKMMVGGIGIPVR